MTKRKQPPDERPPRPEPLTDGQREVWETHLRIRRMYGPGATVWLPPELEAAVKTRREPV